MCVKNYDVYNVYKYLENDEISIINYDNYMPGISLFYELQKKGLIHTRDTFNIEIKFEYDTKTEEINILRHNRIIYTLKPVNEKK